MASGRRRVGMSVLVPEDYFAEDAAADYDAAVAEMFDPKVVEPAVDVLVELAAGGDALEFGIGTGRIAIPLAGRGVRVHGVDLSTAMLARLHDKPGTDTIAVTAGDFATTHVDGEFALVYLVFNTINNLTSQDEQVECFRNAGRHLRAGGCFVIEVGVPQLRRVAPDETFHPFSVTQEHVGIDEYDVVDQGLISHHFTATGDGRYERRSIPFRYVWPAELDLMARIAGLQLEHRWADWDRAPFTADSAKHVSVWRKPQ